LKHFFALTGLGWRHTPAWRHCQTEWQGCCHHP